MEANFGGSALQRGGPVPEPAEPVKADGTSERVAGFAFVELDRCLPTQVRLVQPVQREQRPLEAADLAQCQRQTVLARVSTEPLQHERGAHRSGSD